MNRLLCLFLLAVAWMSLFASDASACNRCGLFGNRCRFAVHHVPHYVAPVVYTPPSQTSNFVFNNVYPVPFLQQGNSVYGFSLASQAYLPDAALILDRSARLTELAITGGQRALGDHNATIQGTLALNADADKRTKDAAVALAYLQNSGAPQQQSVSFRASVDSDGRMSIQQLNAPAGCADGGCQNPNVPPPAPQTLSLNAGPVSLAACARCHDGNGTNNTPRDIVISTEFGIHPDYYVRAKAAVLTGKMPPDTNLSEANRYGLVSELAALRRQ